MPRKPKHATPPIRRDFEREIEGKTYRASMTNERGADWVTVTCEFGSKSAKAGPSGPDVLANILLGEMVHAARS